MQNQPGKEKRLALVWLGAAALVVLIAGVAILYFNPLLKQSREIPAYYIWTADGQEIRTLPGFYSWSYGGQRILADAPAPPNLDYTTANTLTLEPGEAVTGSTRRSQDKSRGFAYTLKSISRWDEAKVETALDPALYAVLDGEVILKAPDQAGLYYYSLQLQYGQGLVTYGFRVIVPDRQPMKGLELYIWKNRDSASGETLCFHLMEGTNRMKDEAEIYDLTRTVHDINAVNDALSRYRQVSDLFIVQMDADDFSAAEIEAIIDQIRLPGGSGSKTFDTWPMWEA